MHGNDEWPSVIIFVPNTPRRSTIAEYTPIAIERKKAVYRQCFYIYQHMKLTRCDISGFHTVKV